MCLGWRDLLVVENQKEIVYNKLCNESGEEGVGGERERVVFSWEPEYSSRSVGES